MVVKPSPSFLIIGAQRAGTTSLFRYLTQHPKVEGPDEKELHYFDLQYERDLDWYEAQFPFEFEQKNNYIIGEASPYYIFHPLVPERVVKDFPEIKLIALLRNPVDRAYSHYHHERRRNRENLPFKEAVAREEKRLEEERKKVLQGQHSFNHQRYSYLERGRYVKQLKRWFEYFEREQFLILIYEDFFQNIDMNRVFEFLDLSEVSVETETRYNSSPYQPMDEMVRQKLEKYFRPYNERLSRLLARNLPWI